jgi:hypothetical protein
MEDKTGMNVLRQHRFISVTDAAQASRREHYQKSPTGMMLSSNLFPVRLRKGAFTQSCGSAPSEV